MTLIPEVDHTLCDDCFTNNLHYYFHIPCVCVYSLVAAVLYNTNHRNKARRKLTCWGQWDELCLTNTVSAHAYSKAHLPCNGHAGHLYTIRYCSSESQINFTDTQTLFIDSLQRKSNKMEIQLIGDAIRLPFSWQSHSCLWMINHTFAYRVSAAHFQLIGAIYP